MLLLLLVSLLRLASVLLKPPPCDAKGRVTLSITHSEWEKCVNSEALSSSGDLKIGNTEHLGSAPCEEAAGGEM